MKILSIDSSSITASAAVTENGKTLAESFINNGLTHSQTLMPMVQKVLSDSGVSVSDLDLLSVTHGPGSFTGVRIGIASVKGIADAAQKDCMPVSTLEAIAEPLRGFDGVVCAVMDARCNQVYTASFMNGFRLCEDRAVLIDELGTELNKIGKKAVFIGDGALLCYERLKGILPDITVADEAVRYIHASNIGFLAERKLTEGECPVKSDKLVPFYLRLPQAERELKKKSDKGV